MNDRVCLVNRCVTWDGFISRPDTVSEFLDVKADNSLLMKIT